MLPGEGEPVPELPPPPRPPDPPAARLRGWTADRWVALPASRRWQLVAAGLAVVVGVLVGGLAWQRQSAGLPELDLPTAEAVRPAGREPVFVHGAGALVRPGLYRLPAGARVADLIEAAGGPTADGDVHQLNLAARVNDGDRVYVPRVGEAPPPGSGVAGDVPSAAGDTAAAKLDLNTATQDQLEDLPGVGPSTALAILDERKRRGRFKSVEDLLEVRGIGPAKLDQIRDLVRV